MARTMDPLLVSAAAVERPPVVSLDVLTASEVAVALERLDASRARWVARSPGFWTFGRAAYLDVMNSIDPEADYYESLGAWNDLLRSELGWLLDRVAAIVAEYVGESCTFFEGVALPGFHIFEGRGIATGRWPNQHFDLQYRGLRWPGPLDEERTLSFTLALEVPQAGAGLEIWDLTEAEFIRLERMGRRVTMESLGTLRPSWVHRYQPGWMALQTRPIMHRIATTPYVIAGDRRITMQGHAIAVDDRWVIYW